jgi:hypothetical protein
VEDRSRVERLGLMGGVVFAAREPPHEPFCPIRFTVGVH